MVPLIFKLTASAAVAFLLTSCGGGSETSSPSAASSNASASLANRDAGSLAKSAVDAGNSSAQLATTSSAFASAPVDIAAKAIEGKAVTQINCASTAQLSRSCVGDVKVDTNLISGGSNSARIPANTYFNITFTGFRSLSAPVDQATTGSVSIAFLDAFTSATTLNGSATIRIDITTPKPEVHTDIKITFRQLSALSASAGGTTLNGGATATVTGEPSVDMVFKDWRTVGNSPQAGSTVTLTSGADSAKVEVLSIVGTQTTFSVTATNNGAVQPSKRVVLDIVNGLPVYRVL
jgi:hypothetical protein